MAKSDDADSLNLAILAAQTADELKAQDIRILQIGRLCGFADYFVICTCQSRVQMKGVAQKIIEGGKAIGHHRLGYEGEDSENWALLDYGDVVVHVFRPEARAYFNLERIWGDAEVIDWSPTFAQMDAQLAQTTQ